MTLSNPSTEEKRALGVGTWDNEKTIKQSTQNRFGARDILRSMAANIERTCVM